MNQCFKSEEAELNIHPIGLILSEIHINISFCNNTETLRNLSNWTHKRVSCSSIELGSVLLDRNLPFTQNQNFSVTININGNVKLNTCLTYAVSIYRKT